jgi:hypothetical protein
MVLLAKWRKECLPKAWGKNICQEVLDKRQYWYLQEDL